MGFELFRDPSFAILSKALDAYSLRHKVSSNNIANANTPGFKRSRVSFESELQDILGFYVDKQSELLESLDQFDLAPSIDLYTESREDGNNVDIEQEVGEMVKNTIRYTAAISTLKKKLEMLRYVITDGRR